MAPVDLSADPLLAARLREREEPAGRPQVMWQRWQQLLFLHWPVEPAQIQSRLPRGLAVDVWNDRAWLGIVPFDMHGIRPRFLPPVRGISWFLEWNVRTYVVDEHGRHGVWFFSLDCDQPFAVQLARRFFHLNYRHATMLRSTAADGVIRDECRLRAPAQEKPASLIWRPSADQSPAATTPGSFEFYLVERYRLFAHNQRHNRLITGVVRHPPYDLAPAELLELEAGHLFRSLEFYEPTTKPLAHWSPGVRVRVHAPEVV